jgi:hypothetical protein
MLDKRTTRLWHNHITQLAAVSAEEVVVIACVAVIAQRTIGGVWRVPQFTILAETVSYPVYGRVADIWVFVS